MTTAATLDDSAQHLVAHRDTWRRKPLLRDIYAEFHRDLELRLSKIPGPTLEVGGGPGGFKEFRQATISFDVIPCPWLDFAGDACRPPIATSSVANIVMLDVLHHLAYPQRFFEATSELLKPGGRLVMIEPYVSPLSWCIYRFIHPEDCAMAVRPLDGPTDEPVNDPDRAWDGNQAIPTALFWRDRRKFEHRYPTLRILERRRMSFLLYPLSGGFGYPALVPARAAPALRRIDRWMRPIARLVAFRCLIVIERGQEST